MANWPLWGAILICLSHCLLRISVTSLPMFLPKNLSENFWKCRLLSIKGICLWIFCTTGKTCCPVAQSMLWIPRVFQKYWVTENQLKDRLWAAMFLSAEATHLTAPAVGWRSKMCRLQLIKTWRVTIGPWINWKTFQSYHEKILQ